MALTTNITPLEDCDWHDALIESISIHPSARFTNRVIENAEQLPDLFVTIRLGGDNRRVQLVLRRCGGLHLEFGIELDVAVIREKNGFLVLWNKGVPTTATWCEAVEWTCSPVGNTEA
jgi:hypothetical protein